MDCIDVRKSLVNKNGRLNGNYLLILDKDPNILDFLNTNYHLNDTVKDKCISAIAGHYNKCVVCGDVITWGRGRVPITCSKKCRSVSKTINYTKNMMDKYGVTNSFQLESTKRKSEQTRLDKYGVKYLMQSEEFKQTRAAKTLETYGVKHHSQIPEVKERRLKTTLDRYGTIHVLQSNHTKDITLSNRHKYIKEMTGYDLSIEELTELKINESIREYDVDYLKSLIQYIRGEIAEFDVESIYDNNNSTFSRYSRMKQLGINVSSQSTPEKLLTNFLDDLDVEYIISDRSVIKPYELDIYIPSKQIAIEFNGDYWHSDKFKDKYYHQNKTRMCNEVGVTLIHIYEHIFNKRFDVYKNIIQSKLGLNDKIYARKCDIRIVSKKEEKEFLELYHLQGFVGSNTCYGLYKDKELLSLCSFGKPRFNSKYGLELLRNCTKSGLTVVGGFSRLIKYAKSNIECNDILCYNDASISIYNPNMVELTQPNYVWINNNKVLSRYNTMKHKLKNILGEGFDPTKSESQNMIDNGYHRVFDSGNYKIIL